MFDYKAKTQERASLKVPERLWICLVHIITISQSTSGELSQSRNGLFIPTAATQAWELG